MKTIALMIALLALAAPALADENYHTSDNKTYTPQQYCNWQDQMLPLPYQKVCWKHSLPIPQYWYGLKETGYAIDLNSIRNLEAAGGIPSGAIATISRNFKSGRNTTFSIIFRCIDQSYAVWSDPDMPDRQAEPGSALDDARKITCSKNVSDLVRNGQ